jgi:hypothetical protein
MMIKLGKAQVFVGKMPQLSQRSINRDTTGSNLLQEQL